MAALLHCLGILGLLAFVNAGQPPPGVQEPPNGEGEPSTEPSTSTGIDCVDDGTSYTYSESVAGNVRSISMNHCPNHKFTNINPNSPFGVETAHTLPAFPQYDPSKQIPLVEEGGTIGVVYGGAKVFSNYGGPDYGIMTDYESSAVYNEGDTFDECGCHSASSTSATYHTHVPPSCTLAQLGQTDTAHSPQIGWALDGFPLYGPRGPGGIMMQTCTETGGTFGVDVCTDDCTGYWLSDGSIDEYVYRYYIQGTYHEASTEDDCTPQVSALPDASYYPFTPACFNGCIPTESSQEGFSGAQMLNSCSGDAVDGYTDQYDAEESVQWPNGLDTDGGSCTSLEYEEEVTAAAPTPTPTPPPTATPTSPPTAAESTAQPSAAASVSTASPTSAAEGASSPSPTPEPSTAAPTATPTAPLSTTQPTSTPSVTEGASSPSPSPSPMVEEPTAPPSPAPSTPEASTPSPFSPEESNEPTVAPTPAPSTAGGKATAPSPSTALGAGSDGGGPSGSTIAGIVILSGVALAAVAGVGSLIYRRRRRTTGGGADGVI